MRKFLKLSYSGEAFHGWQFQPDAMSVQQALEDSLSILLREPVSIVGAGRTDAGVHARVMYAHLDINNPEALDAVSDKMRFLRSLNRLVGKDISVYDIIDVHNDAHARFDASLRTYKYFVTFIKNPFAQHASWCCPSHLDLTAMNRAASVLTETEDFTSFAKLHSDAKTNICNVTEAHWDYYDDFISGDSGIVFTISADRFLRNMVRAVVGTLVDVGRGKLGIEDFVKIVEARNRCSAGTSMPPQALFLWDVKYPYL